VVLTVICADLRGYRASGKQPSRPDHGPHSKRVMALDMVRLTEAYAFPRFSVAGHDRGARVAYRMAFEHPDRIERLAVLVVRIVVSAALQRPGVERDVLIGEELPLEGWIARRS
jgi:haloacetate dehalogenase